MVSLSYSLRHQSWGGTVEPPNLTFFLAILGWGGVCRREESAFPTGTALPLRKAVLRAPTVPEQGVLPQLLRLGPGTHGRGHSDP